MVIKIFNGLIKAVPHYRTIIRLGKIVSSRGVDRLVYKSENLVAIDIDIVLCYFIFSNLKVFHYSRKPSKFEDFLL